MLHTFSSIPRHCHHGSDKAYRFVSLIFFLLCGSKPKSPCTGHESIIRCDHRAVLAGPRYSALIRGFSCVTDFASCVSPVSRQSAEGEFWERYRRFLWPLRFQMLNIRTGHLGWVRTKHCFLRVKVTPYHGSSNPPQVGWLPWSSFVVQTHNAPTHVSSI